MQNNFFSLKHLISFAFSIADAGAISIFFLVSLSVTWVENKYQFLSREWEQSQVKRADIPSDVCVTDRSSESDCHYVNYVERGLRARRWRTTREAIPLRRYVCTPCRRPFSTRDQDNDDDDDVAVRVTTTTCRWLGVVGRALNAMWGSSWTTPRPGTRLAPGRRDAAITRGPRSSVRHAGSATGRSWACSLARCAARCSTRIRPYGSRNAVTNATRISIQNAIRITIRIIIKNIIRSTIGMSVLDGSGRSRRYHRVVATLTSLTAVRPRILIITLIRHRVRRLTPWIDQPA